jgi:hypothetical protein
VRAWKWGIAAWTTLLAAPVLGTLVIYAQEGCLGREDCVPAAGLPGPWVSIGAALVVLGLQAGLLFLIFLRWSSEAPLATKPILTSRATRLLAVGWATILVLPVLAFLAAMATGTCGEYDEGCSTGDIYPFAPKIAVIFGVVAVVHLLIATTVLRRRRP